MTALYELGILDSLPEIEYDNLARLAAQICGAPIGVVSLIDRERQWFKAACGLSATEIHRDLSFCSHAIEREGIFIVEDATRDKRFDTNPMVTGDPGIRFYAGVPLLTDGDLALGTLCVVDTKPRDLTAGQREALAILAQQVQAHIKLRAEHKRLEEMLQQNQLLNARLETSRDVFRAFMNNGPFAAYVKDKAGRWLFYNAKMSEIFQIGAEEWLGKTDHEIWPAEIADGYRQTDVEVLTRKAQVQKQETSPAIGGGLTHWKTCKFPIRHETGEWMLAGISLDITAEQEREQRLQTALKEREEAFDELEDNRTILRCFNDSTPDQVFIKNEAGRYVSYNRAFASFHGIDPNVWMGKTDAEVMSGEMAQAFAAQDAEVFRTRRRSEQTMTVSNRHGAPCTLRVVRFPLSGRRRERLLGGVIIDVTHNAREQQTLKESNAKLEKLATIDALTGLALRAHFEQRIRKAFSESVASGEPVSVLMLDVDNFKVRNDKYGHAAGDEALRLLGRVLKRSVRSGDLAARVGGEEFNVLMPGASAQEAKLTADRIQAELLTEHCDSGPMTVSIGVASRDSTAKTWKRLLARADDAMYEAKRSGKNRVVVSEQHLAELMSKAASEAGQPWRDGGIRVVPSKPDLKRVS